MATNIQKASDISGQPQNTALEIVKLGDPILLKRSEDVEDIRDPKIQVLINNMILSLGPHGVGLAAPQVGQSIRLMIIASRPTKKRPKAKEWGPAAIINPVIIEYSEEKESDWEGCLSIPGIWAKVKRPKWVSVMYYNQHNEFKEETFHGFIARIFFHEFDHLDGRTFLERVTPQELFYESVAKKIMAEEIISKD